MFALFFSLSRKMKEEFVYVTKRACFNASWTPSRSVVYTARWRSPTKGRVLPFSSYAYLISLRARAFRLEEIERRNKQEEGMQRKKRVSRKQSFFFSPNYLNYFVARGTSSSQTCIDQITSKLQRVLTLR